MSTNLWDASKNPVCRSRSGRTRPNMTCFVRRRRWRISRISLTYSRLGQECLHHSAQRDWLDQDLRALPGLRQDSLIVGRVADAFAASDWCLRVALTGKRAHREPRSVSHELTKDQNRLELRMERRTLPWRCSQGVLARKLRGLATKQEVALTLFSSLARCDREEVELKLVIWIVTMSWLLASAKLRAGI